MIRKFVMFLALTLAREQLLMDRHGPTVGAVDKLCAPSSINNGTCLIQNKDIRFTYDFVYTTGLNLVFDNTYVICVTPQSLPCNLYLNLNSTNNLTLQHNSKLTGKQVIIQAQLSKITILDTSTVSVTGQSLNQNGTQVRVQDGAQFVGQGGSCGANTQNYTTFGNYNMLPDFTNLANILNQMGSVGYQGDRETAGGGRIILIADSFMLTGEKGAIEANAMPLKETAAISPYSLVGGSGGYIYLSSRNVYNQNTIAPTFSLEAQGGYGANGNYGGSGGVVVLDGNIGITSAQVSTQGGAAFNSTLNVDGCGNGAAGTLYFTTTDSLIIDNEGKLTPKKTVVKATVPVNGVTPTVGSSLVVDGGASVYINIQRQTVVAIANLNLTDNGTLGFSSGLVQLSIQLGQIYISPSSTLDLSLIPSVTLNATNKAYSLGNVMYSQKLYITGGNVLVAGSVTMFNDTNTENLQNSEVIIDAQSLTLRGANKLIGTSVFIHTVDNLIVEGGYNVTSYLKQTCYQKSTNQMFSCVPLYSLQAEITAESFIQNYHDVYGAKVRSIMDTVANITKGFNVYLMSESNIKIMNSTVHAPRIGLCAPNVTTVQGLINAAEKGCPAGYGIGQGDAQPQCSGSGGAYGGYGGFGLSFSNKTCKSIPQPYFTPAQAIYEGSAGGSAIVGSTLGGAGGGLIWITATDTVTLNSTEITVAGQSGRPSASVGSGGGSGGGLQIITKIIAGDKKTVLDLSGGNGSVFGGGGGSGGRFVTSLLQNFNSTNYKEQSINWRGRFNVAGGLGGTRTNGLMSAQLQAKNVAGDGQDGTTTQTKCFGGFSGPFCKPCAVGTFKYDFGYGVCQPCTNKPLNSYYNKAAQDSELCSYQCNDGLEKVRNNPSCLNSIDLQIERVGGTYGFLIAFAMTLALSLVIVILILARSKCIRRAFKDEYDGVYDGVLFKDTYPQQVSEDDEGYVGPASLHMRDSDIWSHTHRMYFIGENSISYPWFITKDFPTNALSISNQKSLLNMIKSEQHVADWTKCQSFTYSTMRLLFPYLSELVHKAYRRSHFKALCSKLFEAFSANDWEDMTGRTCRMSTDKDSRLAYIDFLDYRSNKSNYAGPQLPMTLLLAGNGTLSSPYTLPFLTDPLAKSLVYLNKEQLQRKLPPFLQNLNTLLDKLCFYKFNRQTMKDLNDVIEWINCGNNTLFAHLNVKMTLYVFENSYQNIEGGNFKQRRRSMPIDSEVFEAFPALFKRLIQHVQLKLLTKNAEIRFGIVVKSVSKEQQASIDKKIRNIQEQLDGNHDSFLELHNTSISCLYDDEDTQEFNTKPKQGRAKGFDSAPLLSGMQTSQVTIHGTGLSSEVKIIDKSKRAYDISTDATRNLEAKLRKDRKRCKHNCVRFKSVVYSLWLLLFKMHGKPPQSNLGFTFIVYAMSLSTELVLSAIVLLHIANPIDSVWTFGFPFLFILPGLTIIAPLFGLLATVCGSSQMLKVYSNMNSSMMINYVLTIAAMVYFGDQIVYQAVVALLIFNKILLSAFGSKVRQHFANPDYAKVMEKMQKVLCDTVAADVTGRSHGMTPAERAAMLVSSGKPSLWKDASSASSGSELGLDEDDHSFGIVPLDKIQPTVMAPMDMSDTKADQITDDATLATLDHTETRLGSVMDSEDQ